MLYIPYDYDLDHIVDLLVTYFFNRTDKISVQAPWESPCPAIPQDDLREILRNHVGGVESPNSEVLLRTSGGEFRFFGADLVGTYFPRPDGMVRVACVDFDNHGPSGGLLDPDNAAYDTADAADRFGLNPYLERSRGGSGVHLWLFFEEWLPADLVREVLIFLIPDNLETSTGDMADPRQNFAVEVFPKSGYVREGGVGAQVWLPFWHRSGGCTSQFFRFVDGGDIEYFVPDDFRRSVISDELLDEVEYEAKCREPEPSPAGPLKSEYEVWRIKALEALSLDDVYGEYLTGREPRPGYLECRDPWSPSGDQNPSASVQTGEDGTVRGRFFSFRTYETMSVFDFLMELGTDGVRTFRDALKWVADQSGVPLPEGRS